MGHDKTEEPRNKADRIFSFIPLGRYRSIRELLAYVRDLEWVVSDRSASSRTTTHISPGTATAPRHQLETDRRMVS
jgi:hypothetical protein